MAILEAIMALVPVERGQEENIVGENWLKRVLPMLRLGKNSFKWATKNNINDYAKFSQNGRRIWDKG